MDFRSSGIGLNVNSDEQMAQTPVVREVTRIAQLAPGAVSDSPIWEIPTIGWGVHTPGQTFASLGGASTGENLFVVNGLNTDDGGDYAERLEAEAQKLKQAEEQKQAAEAAARRQEGRQQSHVQAADHREVIGARRSEAISPGLRELAGPAQEQGAEKGARFTWNGLPQVALEAGCDPIHQAACHEPG